MSGEMGHRNEGWLRGPGLCEVGVGGQTDMTDLDCLQISGEMVCIQFKCYENVKGKHGNDSQWCV